MSNLVLQLSELNRKYTQEELLTAISKCTNMIMVDVPCPSIGVTNWNMDIANDYLCALYVGETIAPFCSSITANCEPKSVRFALKPKNIDALTRSLIWLANGFDDRWEVGNKAHEEVHDSIAEFAWNLEVKPILFDEVADSYLANYVMGIEGLDEENQIEEIYQKYPERRYKFWVSFTSRSLGYDCYSSSYAWIVPHDMTGKPSLRVVRELLRKFGGFKKRLPLLHEGYWISVERLPPVIVNEYTMVSYPHEGIKTAYKCAASIWHRRLGQDFGLYKDEKMKKIREVIGSSYKNERRFKLSEDGDVLLVCDSIAQYIFFRDEMNFAEVAEKYSFWSEDDLIGLYVMETGERVFGIPRRIQEVYINSLEKFFEIFNTLGGNPANVNLPWHELDEDTFEQLCYDIIGQSERFDPDTRRKMGKSRARDGGRDIEIYSRKRFKLQSSKWIVQCKFTKSGHSLSGSKVHVSDVIDQYGAGGFCIMTNALIDSTLHDKLEGIGRNRNIEIDEWDVMRIERTLARPSYRNIRKRYFG